MDESSFGWSTRATPFRASQASDAPLLSRSRVKRCEGHRGSYLTGSSLPNLNSRNQMDQKEDLKA